MPTLAEEFAAQPSPTERELRDTPEPRRSGLNMVDRMVATGLRVADDSGRDETAPLTPMMISVHITGDDIYETLRMPVVPRKGDILSLSSLTLGRSPVLEAVVSKVEWARNQTAAFGENDGIHAWLSVRRTSHSVAFEREQKAKAKAKP